MTLRLLLVLLLSYLTYIDSAYNAMSLRSYLDTRYITNTLESVVLLFKSIGCLIKYLSSYSPDYNLIELVFGSDDLKRGPRSDNLNGESRETRICSVARHYYIIFVFGLH